MKWRLVIYAVVGYVIALAVLVPMKLHGQLAPHLDWFDVIVLPALGVAVLPAYVLVETWRNRGR